MIFLGFLLIGCAFGAGIKRVRISENCTMSVRSSASFEFPSTAMELDGGSGKWSECVSACVRIDSCIAFAVIRGTCFLSPEQPKMVRGNKRVPVGILDDKCPSEVHSFSPKPTRKPSVRKSKTPTTETPIEYENAPSDTTSPTFSNTEAPTISTTSSESPSVSPTDSITKSDSPTVSPSESPSKTPSGSPEVSPTTLPTSSPTDAPVYVLDTDPNWKSPTGIRRDKHPYDPTAFFSPVVLACEYARPRMGATTVVFNGWSGTVEECFRECQFDTACGGAIFQDSTCTKATFIETTDDFVKGDRWIASGAVVVVKVGSIVGYFAGYCSTFDTNENCDEVNPLVCVWNEGKKGWNQNRIQYSGWCGNRCTLESHTNSKRLTVEGTGVTRSPFKGYDEIRPSLVDTTP